MEALCNCCKAVKCETDFKLLWDGVQWQGQHFVVYLLGGGGVEAVDRPHSYDLHWLHRQHRSTTNPPKYTLGRKTSRKVSHSVTQYSQRKVPGRGIVSSSTKHHFALPLPLTPPPHLFALLQKLSGPLKKQSPNFSMEPLRYQFLKYQTMPERAVDLFDCGGKSHLFKCWFNPECVHVCVSDVSSMLLFSVTYCLGYTIVSEWWSTMESETSCTNLRWREVQHLVSGNINVFFPTQIEAGGSWSNQPPHHRRPSSGTMWTMSPETLCHMWGAVLLMRSMSKRTLK